MRARSRRIAIAAGVVAAIALVLVAAKLALDPLAAWRTRRALAGLHGMDATFSAVSVRLWDLSYEIRDLRIDKRVGEGKALPFFSARRIRFALLWRELVHRHVVADVDLDVPRIDLVQTEKEAGGENAAGQEVRATPELGKKLSEATPFLIDRVQVRDGAVQWVDATEPTRPVLRFHGIEATLENFATRPALSRGEPTVLAARGVFQRSGKTTLFATADPLAKKLTFAGQVRLEGLALADLSNLVGSKSGVAPDKGTMDMSIRFVCDGGRLSGGIRPVLKDAGTHAAKPDLLSKIKSWITDTALKIFRDDVKGRKAVATTIPIEGEVTDPNVQLLPTILGVVRNAFVRGLSDSLQGLPPPKAKQKQGAVEQARRALTPGRRTQPEAQPQGKQK